jgi:hypothetical protein
MSDAWEGVTGREAVGSTYCGLVRRAGGCLLGGQHRDERGDRRYFTVSGFNGLAVTFGPGRGSSVAAVIAGLLLIVLAVAYLANVGGFRDRHAREIISPRDPMGQAFNRTFGPPSAKRVMASQIGVGIGAIIFGLVFIVSGLTGPM